MTSTRTLYIFFLVLFCFILFFFVHIKFYCFNMFNPEILMSINIKFPFLGEKVCGGRLYGCLCSHCDFWLELYEVK